MKRLALMIGINEYPALNRGFQLKGCVNDQKLLYQMLVERLGFQEQNIEWLMNRNATRAKILDVLDRYAGMGDYEGNPLVEYRDVVVISFSGYGSRLYYGEDHYQPTIVPVDSDRPQPIGQGGLNLDITDGEILARLERIKERARQVILYFDASHSATISRDVRGSSARSLPSDARYDDVARVSLYGTQSRFFALAPQEKPRSGWLRRDEQYVVLAACADNENAYEYDDSESGKKYGALTYHLVREMSVACANVSDHDLFQRAQGSVNLLFPSQHPQLEGHCHRQLFEMRRVPEPPFVRVLERLDDHRVRLAAGVAQCTTVGSSWKIQSPSSDNALAEVTIRSVGAFSSEAVSEEPLPHAVNESCRAIEIEHFLGDLRLSIGVAGIDRRQVHKLGPLIRSSSLLRLAKEGPLDMAALLLAPRSAQDLANPQHNRLIYAPELGPLDVATWVIVGRDGHLMPAPLYTIDDPDAVEQTFANLERWASYINTHRLRPIGTDPLRNQLKMSLSHESDEGDLEELPIHQESGLPLVEDGEVIRIDLDNHASRALYYVIYSMDAVGNVNRLWPPYDSRDPIDPYDNYPMEATFTAPDQLPHILNGGRETLKVMVTPDYVEFENALEGSRLWNANEAAAWFDAANNGTQEISIVPLSPQIDYETWTIEQIDYYIER
ncbi:MAG: caspase family protein [Ardenticatenaceae bacterium]